MLGSEASSQIISLPNGLPCFTSSNQAEQRKTVRSAITAFKTPLLDSVDQHKYGSFPSFQAQTDTVPTLRKLVEDLGECDS